jgi:hypothetical protein
VIIGFELSPALAAIYPRLAPRVSLELDQGPVSLAEALQRAGIQPMLVLKGLTADKVLELESLIDGACEIKLLSPLSGG